MATTSTYLNSDISGEGVLNTGDTVIYSCPNKYTATIFSLSFNNAAAFDISIRIDRQKTSTSTVLYNFNLDAGDVIQDGNIYTISNGDAIVVTTAVANTTYSIRGQVLPKLP